MKIMIIGASGYIGNALYKSFKRKGKQVIGTQHHGEKEDLIFFDLMNSNIENILDKDDDPQRIAILCSAMTSIDNCFMYEKRAHDVNVIATIKLIERLKDHHYKIIFLSTDNVFSGEKGYYTETDLKEPINVYGRTKAEVEDYLVRNIDNHVILRLSKVVGSDWSGKNLFYEIYQMAEKKRIISCIKDHVVSVVSVDDVVTCVETIIDKELEGIYHISNGEFFERSELVKQVLLLMNIETEIRNRPLDTFSFKDSRPLKLYLDNFFIRKDTGIEFQTIREICYKFMKNFAQEKLRKNASF